MNDIQKYYLTETARWQKLIGIFMAICTGLLVLFGLFFIVAACAGLDLDFDDKGLGTAFSVTMGIVYLLIAVLYYFFTRYLLRSARGIKAWALSGDDADLTDGLRNNKNFFQLSGIMALISICLFALFLLIAIVVAIVSVL